MQIWNAKGWYKCNNPICPYQIDSFTTMDRCSKLYDQLAKHKIYFVHRGLPPPHLNDHVPWKISWSVRPFDEWLRVDIIIRQRCWRTERCEERFTVAVTHSSNDCAYYGVSQLFSPHSDPPIISLRSCAFVERSLGCSSHSAAPS